MTLESLLQAYHAMRGDYSLPSMSLGRVKAESRRFASSQEALLKIAEFKPRQAWISFQSANITLADGKPQTDYPNDYGAILAAECVAEDGGQSLHVRYDGASDGPWLATYFTQGDGETYLVDQVALLATTKALGKLKYRRFWHIDFEQGGEPCMACFIGFSENSEVVVNG